MKIITRYVLKEHIGPFVFALSALTSLLLLQYIARRFGDLVGRGLSWQIITEFFLLSIPFTLAMTLPMSVLVAVLYAFSRLASENEITALKAGGVSSRALMVPALIAAVFLAVFMTYFNDQLLPRANHQLATLQMAILRTKPTFALKPQVINTIKEGQLYLRAGHIDEATGLMQDVTIYDLSDSRRRRTIYADSGTLTLAQNRRDLSMHLFKGLMLTAPDERPGQITRIYYGEDILKVRDVANQFQTISADTSMKGDREMSVCEMQRGFEAAHGAVRRAQYDSVLAVWRTEQDRTGKTTPMPAPDSLNVKAGGIGALYCQMVNRYFKKPNFGVKEAQAAELPKPQQQQQQQQQDTTKRQQRETIVVVVNGQNVMVPKDSIPDDAYDHSGKPIGKRAMQKAITDSIAAAAGQAPTPTLNTTPLPVPGAAESTAVPAPAPNLTLSTNPAPPAADSAAVGHTPSPEILDAKLRLDDARYRRNRYGIEIQKKFSLAFACIVFVLVGAPIALRFPRGGVGLVIGVSFFVFAVYYVGLIGGESLANKNIIPPAWAMWADNIIFLIVGIVLISRMGKEGATTRGGNWGEAMDSARMWFARQGRRVGVGRRAAT